MFPVLYYPTFEPPADWLRSYLLFFDQVQTIVPEDVKFNPSDKISSVVELMPEAFSTVSLEPDDILVDDVNIVRLEKAFQEIAQREASSERDEIIIEVNDEGGIQIVGYVFQHHSKTSKQIRELLFQYKLARREFADFYGRPGEDLVVKEAASNLLLSHIADKVGTRLAVTTVTDHETDFALNAFNALEVRRTENAISKLASAIIRMEIPQEIVDVDPARYKDIREFYAGVREPFQRTLAELSQMHRLESISDTQLLDERVLQIATEFDAKISKLKQTEFGQTLKHWAPIGIGCVLSIIGAAFHQPLISASTTTVSVGLQVYRGLTGTNVVTSEPQQVPRLIAKMQENIFEASKFTAFA